MEIKDLKQGDAIYNVNFATTIEKYEYLCVHPHNSKYHILITDYEEPIRIYEEKLQNILNLNLKSYEEARLSLAKILEEKAKRLREK